VDRYLDLLEECHLVRRVPPFAAGRRLEVTHRPKVLFCDCGLRNLLVRSMAPFPERPDAGALFENWVGAELLKGLDPLHPLDVLRTWRSSSGAEVDWVLDRPDGLVAVEVKAAALRRPQLSRSARSFIAAYSPRDFWVVNLDLCAEEQLGGTRVHWVGPEGLLPGGILR
jgi:predicted AAA+ superfamily ATPase